jgi:hypothetical protein
MQRMRHLLPCRALPVGRGAVASTQGRLQCAALATGEPPVPVWRNSHPTGDSGAYFATRLALDGKTYGAIAAPSGIAVDCSWRGL